MKIGLKRMCSMILLAALLLGILPAGVTLKAFAYTEGDISGTTGKGTANDPVICNSFAELKAALELNNGSSLFYVRLINLPGGSEVLPDVEREDHWDVAPAITAVGTKVLTVEGTPTFIMKGWNAYNEPDYSSLIQVDGSLHVNGSGTLTLEFHGSVLLEGTVFDLNKSTGWLQFDQAVTIRGTVWKDPDDEYTNPICMSVRAKAGKLEISGGNFEGQVWDTSYFAISGYRGAVMLSGSVKATITGGTFRGDPVIQAENMFVCGLTTELDDTGWLKLNGGIFYGIADKDEKPLGRFLASYSAGDYASGHKMVLFDDQTISIVDPSQSRTEFTYISAKNFVSEWHPTTVLDLGNRLVFENQVPNGSGGAPVYYLGEPVYFRFNNMALNDQLVNRGFTIRRSYEIYELADHTFHQSATDISRRDTVVEFATSKATDYVMEETLEMLLDDQVVSTRYSLIPFVVRSKTKIDAMLTVAAPMAGQRPGQISDFNEGVTHSTDALWYPVVDGKISDTPMKSSDTFEAGKRYVLRITAIAKEGYWFTAQSVCYLNSEVCGLDDLSIDTGTACFSAYFTAGSELKKATVALLDPSSGQKPYNAKSPSYGVAVTSTNWYTKTANGRTPMGTNETFVTGNQYYVDVELKAVDGCSFTNQTEFWLGNHRGTVIKMASDGSSATVQLLVSATGYIPAVDLVVYSPIHNMNAFARIYSNTPCVSFTNAQWYLLEEDGTEVLLSDRDVFDASKSYRIRFTVATDKGCYFSIHRPYPTATVNGEKAMITGFGSNELSGYYDFIPEELTTVDVQMALPEAGAAAKTSWLLIEEELTWWYGWYTEPMSGGNMSGSALWDEPFEAGKTYYCYVNLSVIMLQKFSDDFGMTVNGKPLRCVELTDQYAIFELQYTVPLDVAIPEDIHTGLDLNNKRLPVEPAEQGLEADTEYTASFEMRVPQELLDKGYTLSARITTQKSDGTRPLTVKVTLQDQGEGLFTYQLKLKGEDGQIRTDTLTVKLLDPSGNEVQGASYTNSLITWFRHDMGNNTDLVTVKAVGEIDYTVSGNVVIVTHDKPCKLGYANADGKYVALTATQNSVGSYAFTVPTDVTEVILAVKGDISGDGRINVGDVSKLYAHVKQTSLLSGDTLFVADTSGDNRINVGDVSKLYAHVKQTALLTWDT